MNAPRRLSLRWRLVLAFVLVSAPPVLLASYIAAEVISASFERNVERWLDETARFLAREARDGEEDADKSAAIMGEALARAGDLRPQSAIAPFAGLLTAAGYDYVRVEDENGGLKFATGIALPIGGVPHRAVKTLAPLKSGAEVKLAIMAVRPFEAGGQRHYVFVANVLDERFFTVSQGIRSLDVRLFRYDDGRMIPIAGLDPKADLPVPPQVLQGLLAGADSVVAGVLPEDDVASSFAALRDEAGKLVGMILCRVASDVAAFEGLSKWRLFLALALVSGLVSTVVGFFVAERISRPVRALTRGLSAVAAGDYRARAPEEGGRELEELAAGFNAMTEQLDRLRAMEDDMRRRGQLAALGEAAAVIAHEIRNPLGIIKTSSEVVRMRSRLQPSEDRLIGFVLDEVARIDRLVRDVLDYVRPGETQKVEIDVARDVVGRAIEAMTPQLQAHGIVCAALGIDSPARVMGDADQLYQVLLNLFLNAVDAMPDGGRLTVAVERREGAVEIRVEDDGPGLPEDIRARIFDPFFTTKAKGTGLGLARSKAVVEAHGGAISCSTGPSRGAIFVIRMPMIAEQGMR